VNSFLIITGMLLVGLISLIFLYVFVKIIIPQSTLYGLGNDLSEEEILDSTKEEYKVDVPSFRSGLNQGFFIFQMGLYKLWIESGESMLIGTFDNIQTEIDQKIMQLLSDQAQMKEWNDKFIKYIEAKKEPPK
jgi:hypothetical protein